MAARFPKRSYHPRVNFVNFDPQRTVALSIYGLVQFALLTLADLHFLKPLPREGAALRVAYSFLFWAAWCVGGVPLVSLRLAARVEVRQAAVAAAQSASPPQTCARLNRINIYMETVTTNPSNNLVRSEAPFE